MPRLRSGRPQPFTASTSDSTKVASLDGPLVDAFGRLRVSNPLAIFDSKQLFDNQPLFWDDQETSGTGTSSTFAANTASSTLAVGTDAGTRVRQTFQSMNYQPGKSQAVAMTGVIGTGGTGITARLGLFDASNGLFFQNDGGTLSVVRRSFVTGAAVDTVVPQAQWNIDTMDGQGPSRVELDLLNVQIFFIDFQYLGTGRVIFGFDLDGLLVYCHEFLNANELTTVYMSTPNLPIRYEIANDGTGSASNLVHLCSTVYSEGGHEARGLINYESTTTNRAGTFHHTQAAAANTLYALVGLKLKAAYIGTTIELLDVDILLETADHVEWLVLFNPTVGGTFAYADKTNSALQTAIGEAADPSTNTVSALGTVIGGGFTASTGAGGARGGASTGLLQNALQLGANIAGVVDSIVLAARPMSADADVHGGISWRELS